MLQRIRNISTSRRSFVFATAMFMLSSVKGVAIARPSDSKSADFSTVFIDPPHQVFTIVLRREILAAERMGRTPIVYFYADWCGPCRALRDAMEHPVMQEAFRGVHLIRVSADRWDSAEARAQIGFNFDSIPTLFTVDHDGRPTGRITGAAWGADTPANMAPPLRAFFRARH